MNEILDYWNRQPCGSLHPDPTTQRYFVQPHIPDFAQFARWKGKYVLEIGCGIGTDTLEFCRGEAKVWAIDASQKSILIAARRIFQEGFVSNCFPRMADAEDFLPTGPYDLIYSFGVLHHTPHPERVLSRAWHQLANDGELRIMLYAKWSWKHLLGFQPEAQAGCPLVKWYSEREARRLLESCGFKVVSIRKTHIFPWRIDKYVQHEYVKAFPWNITPAWLFKWLEGIMGHHLLLVATKQ